MNRFEHLEGCPRTRLAEDADTGTSTEYSALEQYEATRPSGERVQVTRCTLCGEHLVTRAGDVVEEVPAEVAAS